MAASLDTRLSSRIGTDGVHTLEVMASTLRAASLDLYPHSAPFEWTITGSSSLSQKTITEILSRGTYSTWRPEVLDTTDSLGNRVVRLVPYSPDTPQLTDKEIEEAKKMLSEGVIRAISKIMSNDHTEREGVWFPAPLEKLFQSRGEVFPEEYWTGHADTDYFTKTAPFMFELKEGASPSESIEALLKGPSVLDCGNALQLAHYKALLDFWGDIKFNQVFSSPSFRLTITQMSIIDTKSPISRFEKFTDTAKHEIKGVIGKRPLEIGQECHFKGVPFYGNKHPVGFGGGWNVVYSGDNETGEQLFLAHGFETPMTEREITLLLLDRYNLERTPQDELFIQKTGSPHLHNKSINPFLRTLYTISREHAGSVVTGFLPTSCKTFDPEMILRTKKLPDDADFELELMQLVLRCRTTSLPEKELWSPVRKSHELPKPEISLDLPLQIKEHPTLNYEAVAKRLDWVIRHMAAFYVAQKVTS